MPVELKNGLLVGTVDVPVYKVSVQGIIMYSGFDFSGYTTEEIAKMCGATYNVTKTAIQNIKKHKEMRILVKHKGRSGGIKKGSHKNKIAVNDSDNPFQRKLKQLMLCNKETYSSLARAIGANSGTVKFWCDGTHMPQSEYIKKLADHYNVNTAWLMGDRKASPLRRY